MKINGGGKNNVIYCFGFLLRGKRKEGGKKGLYCEKLHNLVYFHTFLFKIQQFLKNQTFQLT